MRSFFIAGLLALVTIGSPSFAWDPVEVLTDKRLDEHIDHGLGELSNLPDSLARCVSDVVECTEDQIKRIPYAAIWPIIERYKNHLYSSANGKWKNLPPNLIRAAQRFYPEIDLSQVRYAENIDTVHGQAITWHYDIFFPTTFDLSSDADLEWMLHELEHTVQYQRRGGEQNFLSEYVMKAPGKVLERRNFDVHDYIDVERAAIAKGEQVFFAITGRSPRPANRGDFASRTPNRSSGPENGNQNVPGSVPATSFARFCSTPFSFCPLVVGPPLQQGAQCWCDHGFSVAYGIAQ